MVGFLVPELILVRSQVDGLGFYGLQVLDFGGAGEIRE
jgi:hypothetical protein